MKNYKGFAPIASATAKILILGSMPSVASIEKQQYYGHPRNGFWPIMGELFGAHPELDYQQRINILLDNHIAIWDVLQSCQREGSADASIQKDSICINDFRTFFLSHQQITTVLFNGKSPENLYKQKVLPQLKPLATTFNYHGLPSTSPAYAALTLNQKLMLWKTAITTKYD